MTTQAGYHCSDRADLADHLQFGPDGCLCLALDARMASMYLRGGLDAMHCLYAVSWDSADVTAAGEAEIIAAWQAIYPRREWDESRLPIWDAAKDCKVRAALRAAGYDALVYGDSHEGCEDETTELMVRPASLRIVGREEVRYCEEAANG